MPIFKTQGYDSYSNRVKRERIIEERERERQERLAKKRKEEAQRKEAERRLAQLQAAEEERIRKQQAVEKAKKEAELKRALLEEQKRKADAEAKKQQVLKQQQESRKQQQLQETKAKIEQSKKNPIYKKYEGYKQPEQLPLQQQSILNPFGLQLSSPFGAPKTMALILDGLNPYFKVTKKPDYVKQQEADLERENQKYHDIISGKNRFKSKVMRQLQAIVSAIDKAYSKEGIEFDDVDVPLTTLTVRRYREVDPFFNEELTTHKDWLKQGLLKLWSLGINNATDAPFLITNGILGLIKNKGQLFLYDITGNSRFDYYETPESRVKYDQLKFDQAIQLKQDKLGLNKLPSIKVLKPSDYGFFDWYDDAYTSFQVQRNEAERDDFAGRVLKNNEMLGYIDNYEKYLNNTEYIDFIKALMRGEFNNLSTNRGEIDIYSALLLKFNQLDEENPFIGADPRNMSFQELARLKHKLEQDNLKYEPYKHILESYEPGVFGTILGTVGQAKDDLLGYGIKNKVLGSLPSLIDIEEDQLAVALNGLSEAKTNEERRAILNKYKNLSSEYNRYWTNAIKNNQKDIDYFQNKHKVSEWYKAKEEDPNNSNELLNLDTWLYKMPGQMGASSSSWIKQYPGMALKVGGAIVATIGSGGTAALTGGVMAVGGGALSYGGAKSENYAQIFENGNKRFVLKLQQSGQYDNVVKEGRYRTRQPDASDEDIIKLLQSGLWHTSNVKALKALYEAAEGATNVFNRDMAAVGTDEVIDMFLDGMPTGYIAKTAKWTTRNAVKRPMLSILGADKYKKVARNTENVFGTTRDLINDSKGAFDLGMSHGGGLGSGILAASARSTASLIPLLSLRIGVIQEMSKHIPLKLLSKIPGYGRKANTTVRYATDLAGRTMAAGISEGIEEGKQYLHGKAWEEGEVDRENKSLANVFLHDFEAGSKSALVALGIPFRLELTSDAEMIENIKGGMAGGMLHTGSVRVLSQSVPYMRQMKMDDIIYQNMLLDKLADRDTYIKGMTYSLHASDLGTVGRLFGVGQKRMDLSFDNIIELMENRKKNGQEFVDPELIRQEKERMHRVVALSNSKVARDVAKLHSIDKKDKRYNSLISLMSMYREKDHETRDNLFQSLGAINSTVRTSLSRIFGEEKKEEDRKAQENTENKPNAETKSDEAAKPDERLDVDKEVLDKKLVTYKGYKKRKLKQQSEQKEKEEEQSKQDQQEQLELQEEFETVKYSQRERAEMQMHAAAELNAIKLMLSEIEGKTDTHSTFLRNLLNKRIEKIKDKIMKNNWKDFYENTDQYIIDETAEEDLEKSYRDAIFHYTDNEIYLDILKTLFGKQDKDYSGLTANGMIDKVNQAIELEEQLELLIEDDFRELINETQKAWDDAMAKLDEIVGREGTTDQQATGATETQPVTDQTQPTAEQEQPPIETKSTDTNEEQPTEESDETTDEEPVTESDTVTTDTPVDTRGAQPTTDSTETPADTDTSDQATDQDLQNVIYTKETLQKELNKKSSKIKKGEIILYQDEDGNVVPLMVTKKNKARKIIELVSTYDGRYYVKDGKLLSKQEREEIFNKEHQPVKTSEVDETILVLNDKIGEQKGIFDPANTTGMDYFAEVDGRLIRYNRVHSIIGDNYIHEKKDAEIEEIYRKLKLLYDEDKYDELYAELDRLEAEFVKKNGVSSNVEIYKKYIKLPHINGNVGEMYDTLYNIASNFVNFVNSPSVTVGTVVDEMCRLYFAGKYLAYDTEITIKGQKVKLSDYISKEVFNSFVNDLKLFKDYYEKELGWTLFTDRIIWHGQFVDEQNNIKRIAGETDMIAIDKDGRIHIVDYKTSLYKFEKFGFEEKNAYQTISTKEQYSRQLSVYEQLVKATVGERLSTEPIELLPVLVAYDKRAFNYEVEQLKTGKSTLSPIRSINGLKESDGKPRRILLTSTEVLSNDEYSISREAAERKELINYALDRIDDAKSLNNEELIERINKITDELIEAPIEKLRYYEDQLIAIREEITRIKEQLGDAVESNRKSEIQKKLEEISNLLEDAVNRQKQLVKENPNDSLRAVVQDQTLSSIMDELIQKSTAFAQENYDVSDNKLDKVLAIIKWYSDQLERYKNNKKNNTKPAPVLKTGKMPWWQEHNSIDNRDLQNSTAKDNRNIRLADVVTNDDFDINSECELTYEMGSIYGTITYNGHTFTRVKITPANTKEGIAWKNAVLNAIQDATKRSTKDRQLKVVATAMDRTEGIISHLDKYTPVNKTKLMQEKPSYDSDEISVDDISLDFGSNWGICGKLLNDGSCQVRTNGQLDGKFDVIYTIKDNKSHAGSVFCIIKKKYRNSRFDIECLGIKLNDKLVDVILGCLSDDVNATYPGTPFKNWEVVNMLIPYGNYNKKRDFVHIQKIPNTNQVLIQTSQKDSTVYNLDDPKLREFLKSQRINLDFNYLSSRLGSKNSKIRKYFLKNPNINEITLGSTGIVITRNMVFNGKNNEGITGLSLFVLSGLLETKYNGISNCRVCYNGVSVIEKEFKPLLAEKQEGDEMVLPVLGPETLEQYQEEKEQEISGETPSISDLDDMFDGAAVGALLMEKKKGDKLVNTDVTKIERFFKRLFGDKFTFEVVRDLSSISASCVGVCFADAGRIALAQEIVEGTEYHEAFHRIVELFLSDWERNRLYSAYRRKYARLHSMSIKSVKESLTEKLIAEGLAEMYRMYMLDVESIGESNRSLFGKIKAHVKALYKVGSMRGIVAIAMTNIFGGHRFKNKEIKNERIERFKKKFGDHLKLKVRNGVFDNIPDRRTYDMLIDSLVYYFIRANGSIKITGENADKIKIDPEILKSKKEGLKFSLYDVLTSKLLFSPVIANAMKEIFENFDEVSPDIAQRISAMASDYKVKYELEEEQEGVDGEGDTGIGSKIEEHTKASYEFSKIDKTSRLLRFFMSMIEDQELNPDGKFVAKLNQIGHRRFLSYREVMTTLLNDLSDCQTVSEMLLEMNSRAAWNPIYALITPTLNAYWANAHDRNNPNYDQELFVTQLYNLLRSNKNKFKIAKSQKLDHMYTIRIIDSGSDYESRLYRQDWGTYLMSGVTPLFERDEHGNIVEKSRGVATLGAIFDRMKAIQEAFSSENIRNIQDGKGSSLKLKVNGLLMTIDPTNKEHIQIIKNEFIKMLNFMGIQFHMEEFNYLLTKKYGNIKDGLNNTIDPLGFGGLSLFFSETGFDNVALLWNSDVSMIKFDKFENRWKLNIVNNKIIKSKGGRVSAENVFTDNSFVGMLSSAKYQYVHSTDELTILATGGNKYYVVSENNVVSDITKDLNIGEYEIEKLKKSSFVYFDGKTENAEGLIVNTGVEGSIIVKTMSEDGHPKLEVCTMAGFKTDEVGDQGADYLAITEREDYISKMAILQNGGIIFPTMSDKKTYHWLEGIKLPGIDYEHLDKEYIYGFREDGVTLNISEDVLDQFIEYADCEFRNITKTLAMLDKIPDSQKVKNYHKGAIITDKKGNEHRIANGCVLTVLPGIYNEDGTYTSFTKFLDDNGNFVSEEKNLQEATKKFFSLKDDDLKREIMRRTLLSKLQSELDKIESLGLIKKIENSPLNFPYENVGLDARAINMIAKNINPTNPTSAIAQSLAICIYVQDMINKTAMSLMEIERCYSGHPGAFKYKFENGVLVDRQVDLFKRLGGLSSTGVNNNLELMGIPKEYTCAELDDQEKFVSEQFEEIRNSIEEGEYRQAYYNHLVTTHGRKLTEKEENEFAEAAYSKDVTLELIKLLLPEAARAAIDARVAKMSNAYSDINVSDGSTFVSDRMCEWMLRQVGSFNEEVRLAFKILRSDKVPVEKQLKYYHKIVTSVIGALKYTAFGLHLNENGELIPYYHKTAMFPLFKCMATGKMAKMLKLMQDQEVDMVLMNSSVKVGSQGSLEYHSEGEFNFNKYKRDFRYLRKQFNTDPHHREEMAIGTQMMKVVFASLLKGKDYDLDGKTVKGRDLLQSMMNCINSLADMGADEIRDRFIQDGRLNVENFSKFLIEQLLTREADKNLIEAIELEYSYDDKGNKIEGSGRFKLPLAATSGMAFIQSIIVSMINKKVVDVNTDGNAFYQRSAFNMENETIDVIGDGNIPKSLNNGESLKMINEYGCIDCVLSIDYFADILNKAGLKYASFDEQKEFLKKHGIIGGKPTLVGYRIPTQAQSSIHAMRCVDVLPVVNHTIMLPKDFTKTTGSDFDIDKIFISGIKFEIKTSKLEVTDEKGEKHTKTIVESVTSDFEFGSKHYFLNELIRCYIALLSDKTSKNINLRSIDNDTDLLLDVLHDIVKEEVKEVRAFDFYTLSNQCDVKNDYTIGKSGIGPFALNNNNHILCLLYDIEFHLSTFISQIGYGSLHRINDDAGNNIGSWLSALINAHVDIAKDPYVTKLLVTKYSYNLVNLLIRTGMGDKTFYFLCNPIMRELVNAYDRTNSLYLKDGNKSQRILFLEEQQKLINKIFGLDYYNQMAKDMQKGRLLKFAKALFSDEGKQIMRDIIKKGYKINDEEHTYELAGGTYNVKAIQCMIMLINEQLQVNANQLSNLVKYTKIDTKKQGKNISETLAYARGYYDTFNVKSSPFRPNNPSLTEDCALLRLRDNTYIGKKTETFISLFFDIMKDQTFEGNDRYRQIMFELLGEIGTDNYTPDLFLKIQQSINTAIKSDFFNDYCLKQGIDIKGLISGNNTIYDRLNKIKIDLLSNLDDKSMIDKNGEIRNVLLKLLISGMTADINPITSTELSDDTYKNMKFVRLFDGIDSNSAKTNYIIQAWEDLLNDTKHPELLKFARDLAVYAFYTSGDFTGATKLFKYVPNKFKEESGFNQYINDQLNILQKNPKAFNIDIDDIILNNWRDNRFIPTVNPAKDYYSCYYDSFTTKNGGTFRRSYPVVMIKEYGEKNPPRFIKVKRTDCLNKNSQRSYVILKLQYKIIDEDGNVRGVYGKINPKGNTIGNNIFTEYGRNDNENNERVVDINKMFEFISSTINGIQAESHSDLSMKAEERFKAFDNSSVDSFYNTFHELIEQFVDEEADKRKFKEGTFQVPKTEQFPITGNTLQYGIEIDPNLKSDWQLWQQDNPNGIVAYRVNFNKYNTPEEALQGRIGNPFSEKSRGESTVEKFFTWLVTGNNFGEQKATEEYRQAIINKIKESSTDTKILYYKELNRPSHATVIGYLINNKHLLENKTTLTEKTQQITQEALLLDESGNPVTVYRGYAMKENRFANTIEETVAGTAMDYIAKGFYFTSDLLEAELYAKTHTDKSEEPTKEKKINRHYVGDYAKISSFNLKLGKGILEFEDIYDFDRRAKDMDISGYIIKLKQGTLTKGNSEYFVTDANQVVFVPNGGIDINGIKLTKEEILEELGNDELAEQQFSDTLRVALQGKTFNESLATVLSVFTKEEQEQIKKALGGKNLRVMSVSRYTDVGFPKYADQFISFLKENAKKPLNDPTRVLAVEIWTKHDGEPIAQILEACKKYKVAPMVSFSITGLGDGPLEKGVLKYKDLLNRIELLIQNGYLDPRTTTIRIDPILPGYTNMEDIKTIVQTAKSFGIKKFVTSLVQSYGYSEGTPGSRNVVTNINKALEKYGESYNWDKYYGRVTEDEIRQFNIISRSVRNSNPTLSDKEQWGLACRIANEHGIEANGNPKNVGKVRFLPKKEYIEKVGNVLLELNKDKSIEIETCSFFIAGLKESACLDPFIIERVTGIDVTRPDGTYDRDTSRPSCFCYGCHGDFFKNSRTANPCYSGCAYCYMGQGIDSKLTYYNEDGSIKDVPNTRVDGKQIGTSTMQTTTKDKEKAKPKKVSKPSTFKFKDGTSVDIPFTLNEQQKEALYKLEEFLEDPKLTSFTLAGYAGTGKTTIMKIFEKRAKKNMLNGVVYASPTHAANAVTRKNNPGISEVYTIQLLLGIRGDIDVTSENFDVTKVVFVEGADKNIHSNSIIIMDESSMINKDLYKLLIDTIKLYNNVKIVFLGDPKLLLPVGSTEISPVFTLNKKGVTELTQVERTGDNGILNEATNLREGKQLSYKTLINDKGEGIEFTNSRHSAIHGFAEPLVTSEEYKENSNYFKVLVGTNAAVDNYNSAIRSILFGERASEEFLIEGETLTAYDNSGRYKNPMGKIEYNIINSGNYKVLSIDNIGVNPVTTKKIGFKVSLLEVKLRDENTGRILTINMLDPNSEINADIADKLYELKQKAINATSKLDRNRLFALLYSIKNSFTSMNKIVDKTGSVLMAQTFKYGYAMTVHKSLGSTYDNVLIDGDTFSGAFDHATRQLLKYVAVTRAKTKVEYISSEVKEDPVDPSVQSLEKLGEEKMKQCKW